MKTIKSILAVLVISSLAGCTSSASRMADCEAQGISRDTCYSVEQNRKSNINAAAEKQALENSQALYPVQAAQSAHKHAKHKDSYKQLTSEAEATINAPIGEAADFLISCGWLANKGQWHKQGYILTLVVENGVVLNAQLTK